MNNDIIRVDYEMLKQIANQFGSHADIQTEMHRQVMEAVGALRDGGWIGTAADAFFDEMDATVSPALLRLSDAFVESQKVTLKISELMRLAEEEAARPFQGRAAASGEAAPTEEQGQEGSSAASLWSQVEGWVHGILDVVGLIPGYGEIADGVNGVIYLIEGRKLEAGLSFAAIVPFFGWGATALKFGLRGGRAVLKEGAERVARETLEEGVERGVREGVETGVERGAREGAKELSDYVAKYGQHARDIQRRYGDDAAKDILSTYDEIADVPGANHLLDDLVSGSSYNSTSQGALSEIGYAASLKRRGIEIDRVGDIVDGKKAGDIVLKDGTVIDVKDYNWSSPYYQNPNNVQKSVASMRRQVLKHQERYPGQPIEYAFTDLANTPRPVIDALEEMGVSVKQVTWPRGN